MTASMVLVGIAVLRWMAVLAGLGIVAQWAEVLGPGYRVLHANSANMIALAFFASMFLNIDNAGPLWQRKAFYLLGPVLLLLQHRTVWVVVLIGFLWLGLQEPRFRKQAITAIVALAILGAFTVFVLFGKQSEVAVASLQDSASSDDTFLWRVAGWYQLLFANPARNVLNDLIGQPFGTGFDRVIAGVHIDTAPHSYYVEMLLRVGVIGTCFLLRMYVLGMRRMKRLRGRLSRYAYPDSRFWAMVLLLQLVFFFTYTLSYEQSILTGVALAGLRQGQAKVPAEPIVEPA
jgi:O-antigen ligase